VGGSDRKPRGRGTKSTSKSAKPVSNSSRSADPSSHVTKSPAKRHAKQRLSIRSDSYLSSEGEEANEDDDAGDWRIRRRAASSGPAQAPRMPTIPSKGRSSGGGRKGSNASSESEEDDNDNKEAGEEEEEEEEEEPLKLGRIIACRTETRARWREICQGIQTSEIDSGSRWNQPPVASDNDHLVYEERFLVKWKDLSYLHCSWETQADLEGQLEAAKQALTQFFRKSKNGLLYGPDERCDGDYYDPGWVQIDRLLEVHLPEDGEDFPDMTAETEDSFTPNDFGIVLDKSDDRYEDGTGRQFLIKWTNLGYAESSYEFERDLILNDVEYKSHLKSYLARSTKPPRSDMKDRSKKAEALRRQLYKTFGDNSPMPESKRDKEVDKFKTGLLSEVHKNGGQLRDYQAEGVAWMISNYINKRSFILADEMGLYVPWPRCCVASVLAFLLMRFFAAGAKLFRRRHL
jgi:Chromo (CHRromatin Organisation MOdifier) domain